MNKFKRILIPFCITVLTVISFWYYTNFKTNEVVEVPKEVLSAVSPEEVKLLLPDIVKLRILNVGEVFWGRYINDWSNNSTLKTAYPFSALNTFEKEKYDAWLSDIECPITDVNISSPVQEETLSFNCNSKYTPEYAKWFEIATLANNHTDNMETYNGERYNGFQKTKDILKLNNVQTVGHYDNKIDSICSVVKVKNKKDGYLLPIAMCGFHNVFGLPSQDKIDVIKKYSKYLPTFVYPHQGKEYQFQADELQESMAHQYIDNGADAVLGTHVHVVQNTEVYKNKLIVYSMGNFIFDQQTPKTSQAFGVDMTIDYTKTDNLEKLAMIAKDCNSYSLDCYDKIAQANLPKPTFKLRYEQVVSDNSGKLVKKASQDVIDIVQERTNWLKTIGQLKN
jgi:Bacterial capsule synthesis protein PGA_cap